MAASTDLWNGEDELFDFDFFDELSAQSDTILIDATAPVLEFDSLTDSTEEINDIKTLKQKGGAKKIVSKFRHKVSHSTKMKPRPVPTDTGIRCLKPNMSRRTRDTTLYAFPSFDRCDSLLFFATTLSRHLNCGDIPSVASLFSAQFDKQYSIDMGVGNLTLNSLTTDSLVRAYECSNILHPDKISCIHSTRVNGNQIKAVGFLKFTNCRALYDSVAMNVKGKHVLSNFNDSWEESLRRKIDWENPPPEVKEKLLGLVDSGSDLLVYSRFELILTIDDTTKKIKHLRVTGNTTSMQEARHDTGAW